MKRPRPRHFVATSSVPMDASPCIAGSQRDPSPNDGESWKAGSLWLNTRTRRVFSLVRGGEWQDVTNASGVANTYVVAALSSEPLAAVMKLIDTWI